MRQHKLVSQKVSYNQKKKKDWYIPNFDYFDSLCTANDDHTNIEKYYDIYMNGIGEGEYKSVLRPYSAELMEDERFGKLPGKIRNLDIITPLLERYMGEYIAQYDNFVVTNTHPKALEEREAKVTADVLALVVQLFMEEFNKKLAEAQAQMKANPEAQVEEPKIEKIDFVKFIEQARIDWGRAQTIKNKRMLKLLSKITDAETKYIEGFFHWFVSGRVITHHSIYKGDVIKEIIHPIELRRYGKSKYLQDDTAHLRTYNMTIHEIIDRFSDDLEDKIIESLEKVAEEYTVGPESKITFMLARDMFGVTDKSDQNNHRELTISDSNGMTVKHLVWLTKVRYYELRIPGMAEEDLLVLTEEEYPSVKDLFDSSAFTTIWSDEYFEQYQFGPDGIEIYTIPRPIAVQESDLKQSAGVKSSYNGIYGDITNLNTSKLARLIDYQVLINTFAYQLARMISKNQGNINVIPESLLEESDNYDMVERFYYMVADNKLILNDEDDTSLSIKAQMLKNLDMSLHNEIKDMMELIEYMKGKAWDAVAMNEERYGNINPNAGKAVTEQTIFRSSLGSRLTFDSYNNFVARDHEKSLNYSRVAYADGKTDAIMENGEVVFVTLGNQPEVMYDLGVSVKYSSKERENIDAMKQGAFSMFQNDHSDMAVEVLNATSTDEIADAVKKYSKIQQEFALKSEQIQNQREEIKNQGALAKINLEKEWDYKIEELKLSGKREEKQMDYMIAASTQEPVVEEDNSFDNSIKERETKVKEKKLIADILAKNKELLLKEKDLAIKARRPAASK